MRILLDECVHRKVRDVLHPHAIQTVQEAGWRGVKNGELLRLAATRFDVFLTSDKNIEYQQHRNALPIAVIIISTKGNMWEDIEPVIPRIQELLLLPLNKKFYRVK